MVIEAKEYEDTFWNLDSYLLPSQEFSSLASLSAISKQKEITHCPYIYHKKKKRGEIKYISILSMTETLLRFVRMTYVTPSTVSYTYKFQKEIWTFLEFLLYHLPADDLREII